MKNPLKQNSEVWDALPQSEMHVDTNFVMCQKRLFPHPRGEKVLYIGFGEGQNLLYLAEEGFKVYGTEIASSRVRATKEKFRKKGLTAELKLVDSNRLPFEDNFFDIVIAWQSLCYNDSTGLDEALGEVLRILKPGGKFLSSMVSIKQKLLCGKEIAPSVFRPQKKDQSKCVIFCFKNKQQIRKKYRKFEDVQIGFYASELFGSPKHHFAIYASKPGTGNTKT